MKNNIIDMLEEKYSLQFYLKVCLFTLFLGLLFFGLGLTLLIPSVYKLGIIFILIFALMSLFRYI